MKIATNNAVYVQKNDLAFLYQTDLCIPATIFLKLFGEGVCIINDSNRYEFVKFESEEEVAFLSGLDWIVEYDSVKDFNRDQFIELSKSIVEQRNKIAKKYNSMTSEERRANNHMVYECERLEFKNKSLIDVYHFTQGNLQFTLPEELSDTYKESNEKSTKKLLRQRKKSDSNN